MISLVLNAAVSRLRTHVPTIGGKKGETLVTGMRNLYRAVIARFQCVCSTRVVTSKAGKFVRRLCARFLSYCSSIEF